MGMRRIQSIKSLVLLWFADVKLLFKIEETTLSLFWNASQGFVDLSFKIIFCVLKQIDAIENWLRTCCLLSKLKQSTCSDKPL